MEGGVDFGATRELSQELEAWDAGVLIQLASGAQLTFERLSRNQWKGFTSPKCRFAGQPARRESIGPGGALIGENFALRSPGSFERAWRSFLHATSCAGLE